MAVSGKHYRLRFSDERKKAESDATTDLSCAEEDGTRDLQDEEDEEEEAEEACDQLLPEQKGVDKANVISKLFWW